jgi:hypothetical protein
MKALLGGPALPVGAWCDQHCVAGGCGLVRTGHQAGPFMSLPILWTCVSLGSGRWGEDAKDGVLFFKTLVVAAQKNVLCFPNIRHLPNIGFAQSGSIGW